MTASLLCHIISKYMYYSEFYKKQYYVKTKKNISFSLIMNKNDKKG
jgi:hypothetical protein